MVWQAQEPQGLPTPRLDVSDPQPCTPSLDLLSSSVQAPEGFLCALREPGSPKPNFSFEIKTVASKDPFAWDLCDTTKKQRHQEVK